MRRAGVLFFAFLLIALPKLRAEKIDNRNFAIDTYYPTPNEIQLAEQRARQHWAKHGARFGPNPIYLVVVTSKIFPGRFTDFSGQISFDEANPEQSRVEVTVKTASVNTDNDTRDKDLRSSNFFDVEKFPEMTFRSKSVKRTGQNTADVTGDLTMHGVTKEVVLKVEFTGKGKGAGPQGTIVPGRDPATMVSGWEATTTLQRSDFGITWNQMIEGTRVVGDDVQIELRVEAESLLTPRDHGR
jgi:polyisoprenoid-binding protein YceI